MITDNVQQLFLQSKSKHETKTNPCVWLQLLLLRGSPWLLPDVVSGSSGLPVPQHRAARAAARPRLQPRAVPLRQGPAHPDPVGEHPVWCVHTFITHVYSSQLKDHAVKHHKDLQDHTWERKAPNSDFLRSRKEHSFAFLLQKLQRK